MEAERIPLVAHGQVLSNCSGRCYPAAGAMRLLHMTLRTMTLIAVAALALGCASHPRLPETTTMTTTNSRHIPERVAVARP